VIVIVSVDGDVAVNDAIGNGHAKGKSIHHGAHGAHGVFFF